MVSDINGYCYDPNGLDIDYIVEEAKKCGDFSKEYIKTHKDIRRFRIL